MQDLEKIIKHLRYIELQNKEILQALKQKNVVVASKMTEYLTNKSDLDFIDKSTRDTFNYYKEITGDDAMNQTRFNRIIKKHFNLTIKHTFKNKEQIYVWRRA